MNPFSLLTWEALYLSFNSKWQSCCVFSVVGFPLSQLYINHATFFRSAKFLHKYQLIDLWESFLVCDSLLFSFCLQKTLSLTFAVLIIICLDVLLGFILFRILCASCIWISDSLFRFKKFSAIISSDTFSIPFFLFSFRDLWSECWYV